MKSKYGNNIRYAVIGLGHIAQVAVLPAFSHAQNSKLVAVVSDDPEKRREVSRQYGVERVYSYEQYEECLSQSVDAVYISLPNHLHRDYAIRASNAGVHVLCEKPMAVSEKDCKAMIKAAETNHCKLMVAYRLHFEKGNLEAMHAASEGRLGDLRFFSSEFSQHVVGGNIRVTEDVDHGGGPVYDMGVYCINAARNLFRSEPSHVYAVSASNGEPRFHKVEEMASVIMQFPGERLAMFTASFGAADISRYTLVGTKGSLLAEPAYEYAQGINLQLTVGEKKSKRKFAKEINLPPN
jgi:predicted dehydrogenase